MSFDFQYNGNIKELALQKEVLRWGEDFHQLLERELDALCKTDKYIVIDRVEIAVETNNSNWQTEITETLSQLLREKLKKVDLRQQGEAAQQIKQSQIFAEAFISFLKSGYLPWNYFDISFDEWNGNVRKLVSDQQPVFISRLIGVLASSSVARARLRNVLSFSEALALFAAYDPELIDDTKALLHEMQVGYIKNGDAYLFPLLIAGLTKQPLGNDVSGFFEKEKISGDIIKLMSRGIDEKILPNKQFKSEWFKQLQQAVMERGVFSAGKQTKPPKKVSESGLSTSHQKDVPFHRVILPEEIYITNAGLIILAAFLPMFFKKLGLVKNEKLIHPAKAAFISGYLVKGERSLQEFELVLPKILCGLAPSEFVDTNKFRITHAIKMETNNLLASVIEHWGALKNTSPEGLRNSFLMRNGKLIAEDEGLSLSVESAGYDMLLNQLPWNISLVKLPWMERLLKTNWIF